MRFRDFLYFSCVNFVFLAIFGVIFWFSLVDRRKNQAAFNEEVEKRISSIVISTLYKVREDLGVISPVAGGSDNAGKDEKKVINIEGARLSTFEHHFYIDGTPFFIGDVVAPYGMAVSVGRDMVIFDDFNGGTTVLGKSLPVPVEKKKESEQKNAEKTV